MLVNTYHEKMNFDGETIASQEGTTQGDPLAMAMYSLGVIPLIMRTSGIQSTRQVWYAHDSTTCGTIDRLLMWGHKLVDVGPTFGYFPNPSKTWLLVKEDLMDKANELFHDTGVFIMSEDRPVLGSPVGTPDFISNWVKEKIDLWVDELLTLTEFSKMDPQAVYSSLTHGWMSHWTYLSRTCPDISPLLHPLEDTLRSKLLPSLTSQATPNDTFRDLFALPCRHGGLSLPNPVVLSTEFVISMWAHGRAGCLSMCSDSL